MSSIPADYHTALGVPADRKVHHFNIISSTKYHTRVGPVLQLLLDKDADPTTVVILAAKAPTASKLVSIVEIIKREFGKTKKTIAADEHDKRTPTLHQYTTLISIAEDKEALEEIRKQNAENRKRAEARKHAAAQQQTNPETEDSAIFEGGGGRAEGDGDTQQPASAQQQNGNEGETDQGTGLPVSKRKRDDTDLDAEHDPEQPGAKRAVPESLAHQAGTSADEEESAYFETIQAKQSERRNPADIARDTIHKLEGRQDSKVPVLITCLSRKPIDLFQRKYR